MATKSKPTKDEVVVTEEQKQNDIIIRSICKKTRNLTKKLADIEQLEKRGGDYKPEQLEKLRSKNSILEERKRTEEFLKFYKSIIAENAAENKTQLQADATRIAQIIVLAQYLSLSTDAELPAALNQQEAEIIRHLGDINHKDTLGVRALGLAKTIKIFLENTTVGAKLEDIFQSEFSKRKFPEHSHRHEHQHTTVPHPEPQKETAPIPQPEPVPEEKPQPTPTPVQTPVEQTEAPKAEETTTPVAEPVTVTSTAPAQEPVATEAPVAETPQTQTTAAEERPETAPVPETASPTTGEGQTRTQRPEGERRPYKPRGNNPNYRGGERGPRQPKEGGEQREGGNYRGNYRGDRKPRYHQKREENAERDSSLSSSEEREYQRREFNKNEIRELEKDGFIVVPQKQKPKDINERNDYHRKQHGFKDRKHHQGHNDNNNPVKNN